MLRPTNVMGVYRQLEEDTYYIRDLRTGQMQPTEYKSFQEAVDAQAQAEKPADATGTQTENHPVSVLYIATKRQVENLAAEVYAWGDLLTHPMLNAPEARNV